MTVIDFTAFLDRLASASGETILPFFRTSLGVENKNTGHDLDPVTEADRAAEAVMRRLIKANFPQHGIVGEEFGDERADAEYVWVLDPIDGTKSFISGLPIWGTLIALILVDCHSMPSIGISRDEPRRPDVVIGDRYGTSCASQLPNVVEDTLVAMGYTVGRNKPYAGGFITEHYGNPASGLHTIQIELNRAIYMDERKRERTERFNQIAADFATLARALAAVPLGNLGPFEAAAE